MVRLASKLCRDCPFSVYLRFSSFVTWKVCYIINYKQTSCLYFTVACITTYFSSKTHVGVFVLPLVVMLAAFLLASLLIKASFWLMFMVSVMNVVVDFFVVLWLHRVVVLYLFSLTSITSCNWFSFYYVFLSLFYFHVI